MISIIIPVFNLQNYIGDCIESVINQTFQSLQIILVDDGSTDHSYDICQHYAQKDERIQIIQQENRGVSAARNTGLQKATGNYVMFIDGDDTVAPDYVESYITQAESMGADIVVGGYTKKESGNETQVTPLAGIYDTKEFLSLLCKEGTQVYGYVWCKLFRLSLIKEDAFRFNENMYSQEDLDFALSLYGKAQKVCCFDNCGYFYSYAPSSRKPSAQAVLGNQVKLFQIAEEAGAETKPMLPRFQSMLYSWLYHADTVQTITDIINIGIPDALMSEVDGQRREVKKIIQLFHAKKSNSIYQYFSARNTLRGMMVKLHLAKPLQ